MAGLHLHRSNHVEALADGLVRVLADPLTDPLQAEVVVVQSLGMRRWLSFQIARRLGITMNCDFPFIAEFAQRVFRTLSPERGSVRAFSREALPWRVLAGLGPLAEEPAFATLKRYIGGDEASAVKEFQLAQQIATVFDQYLAYIPERLLQWDAGQEEAAWQPRLWRELSNGWPEAHPAALLRQLHERFEREAPQLEHLPARVSVFGIASLPPFYLRLLAEVCRAVEVHLFLFEPTDLFWGELRSAREQRKILQRHPGQTAADLHLEMGNELLASFGRAGRAFSVAVQDLEPTAWHEDFRPPDGGTMLQQVQAEIFEIRGEEGRAEPLPTGDGSIQIHCCHGPMREVEVLHDHLLELFEKLPGLTPKDVLVTMPSVESHAPYIEAVFGAPESEATRIPFTIADRSARAESGVARAFLRLLDLHGSRFTAGEVLELLESRAVRERFEIGEGDLETVRLWVTRNHIRWGIDAAHRQGFDLPGFAQNTWRAGLDRMLLGYAFSGDGETLFADILPDGGIEGGAADLLGRFAEFSNELFELIPRLSEARTLGEWSDFLAQLLDTFFTTKGEDAAEVLSVRKTAAELAQWEDFHAGALPFAVLRAHLATLFTESEGGSGFIAGHVTFCSLRPMRSIPFRVICMLGMSDGAFPRRETPIAFDLLAENGAAAGRSRRDEDRQLFLESILSARDVFYVSYTGLSTKDNSEAPPSVVVSELIDYLAAGDPDAEARARIVTPHPLQAFSPKYFHGEGRLFSYSEENSRAFADARGIEVSAGPYAAGALPEAEIDWQALDLRVLVQFFRHPPKYFSERRLGLRLPKDEDELGDCEPLELGSLDRWRLSQNLAAGLLAGRPVTELEALLRAEGLLPAGHFGGAQVEATERAVRPLVQRMAAAPLGPPLPPHALAAAHGEWQVLGTLETLHENGLRFFTGWELSPKDRLRAWLEHLLLNAAAPAGLPRTTFYFSPGETIRYAPCANAVELLGDLVAIFREGMRRPLPYFPKASYDFARRTLHPRPSEGDPAKLARKVYDTQKPKDLYNELCFRHLPTPCGAEWQELALRIWKPAMENADA